MKAIHIFIGIQASGKSTFFKENFSDAVVYISMDQLHNRNREQTILREALGRGQEIVIDNTNPTTADRKRYIPLALSFGYNVYGYYFRSSIGESIARNELRSGKEKIVRHAIAHTHSIMVLPTMAEGFNKLFYVYMGNNRMIAEEWRQDNEI